MHVILHPGDYFFEYFSYSKNCINFAGAMERESG